MGDWGNEGLKGELEDHRGQQPVNLKARHFQLPKQDQKGSQWRSLWGSYFQSEYRDTHLLMNLRSLLNSRVSSQEEELDLEWRRVTKIWNLLALASSVTSLQA